MPAPTMPAPVFGLGSGIGHAVLSFWQCVWGLLLSKSSTDAVHLTPSKRRRHHRIPVTNKRRTTAGPRWRKWIARLFARSPKSDKRRKHSTNDVLVTSSNHCNIINEKAQVKRLFICNLCLLPLLCCAFSSLSLLDQIMVAELNLFCYFIWAKKSGFKSHRRCRPSRSGGCSCDAAFVPQLGQNKHVCADAFPKLSRASKRARIQTQEVIATAHDRFR